MGLAFGGRGGGSGSLRGGRGGGRSRGGSGITLPSDVLISRRGDGSRSFGGFALCKSSERGPGCDLGGGVWTIFEAS